MVCGRTGPATTGSQRQGNDPTRRYRRSGDQAHKVNETNLKTGRFGERLLSRYHLLAPSLGLPDNYTDLKFEHVYPAFVKPDKKVSRNDIFKVHRCV